MTGMDLETNRVGKVVGPCENCGHRGHEHEKTRVFHENGTWSWDYTCPEDPQ